MRKSINVLLVFFILELFRERVLLIILNEDDILLYVSFIKYFKMEEIDLKSFFLFFLFLMLELIVLNIVELCLVFILGLNLF